MRDWSTSWLDTRIGVRSTTRARDASYIRNHIEPHLGAVPLSENGFDHIQEWVGKLVTKGVSSATLRKAHQILAQIMDYAVKARRISAARLDRQRNRTEDEPLTDFSAESVGLAHRQPSQARP